MSPEAAKDLKRGDVLIGTERLWRGGGALGLGRASVEFAPDPDPPAAAPILIPVMRLHRPRHSSCEAAFTNQTKTTDSIDMKVEILGVGAGGGYEFGMTLKDEYVARTDCVETVIPAKLQLIPGKTLVNGTEIGYSIRAKVTDADVSAWRTRAIPRDQDDCERSGDALAGLISVPYNYSEAPEGDTDTQEISVESKAVGRMSVGLEMAGSVPINLGIDYERTTQQATTLRIVLATGVRYLAMRRPAIPRERWGGRSRSVGRQRHEDVPKPKLLIGRSPTSMMVHLAIWWKAHSHGPEHESGTLCGSAKSQAATP